MLRLITFCFLVDSDYFDVSIESCGMFSSGIKLQSSDIVHRLCFIQCREKLLKYILYKLAYELIMMFHHEGANAHEEFHKLRSNIF